MVLIRALFSVAGETFKRFATPPTGSELFNIVSTSYRLISKLVTALEPLNFMAAMS